MMYPADSIFNPSLPRVKGVFSAKIEKGFSDFEKALENIWTNIKKRENEWLDIHRGIIISLLTILQANLYKEYNSSQEETKTK